MAIVAERRLTLRIVPAGITAGLERDVLVLVGLTVTLAHAAQRDPVAETSNEASIHVG